MYIMRERPQRTQYFCLEQLILPVSTSVHNGALELLLEGLEPVGGHLLSPHLLDGLSNLLLSTLYVILGLELALVAL